MLNLRSFRGIKRVNFKLDILNNDIPANGLHKNVSDGLKIPYLSNYKESQEELIQKLQYKGAIIGDHSRFFFQFQLHEEILKNITMFTTSLILVHHIQL